MADDQTKDRISIYQATNEVIAMAKLVIEADQSVESWVLEDGIPRLREHCERFVGYKQRLHAYLEKLMTNPYREDKPA